ncbi:MAG: Zinc ABC transporter, ATP-binding protein ZnuC [uncultured Sulfurovum sp.]|uniref:Zinc ABC transporter, ATP-binding protein ZnuC n=1 Tax=uncultured Sulfurovum sp. TaxID=269237 RepID=A0A6S6SF28_9BACT|nr:MAG: Zinc ABC transporter, ATP-binding protein ZnuC [uncultured Sulfurovum sp.]
MQLQTQTKVAIEASNLSFSYEKQIVLEDIHFQIKEKEFLAIIGPNGGGKSTLLKLILGINTLQKGKINIFNEPHTQQTQYIGYVPQNTNINTTFPISVLEVVMMGQNSLKQRIFGYKEKEKQQAYDALEKVNMREFASNTISELSGGQRQRVFIARALFSNPKILLLDEPTSSVDIQWSKQVYETLKTLNKEITVVVVSHDISVILQYATRAFHINKKLVNHGLDHIKNNFEHHDTHVCEVELLEMLGASRC